MGRSILVIVWLLWHGSSVIQAAQYDFRPKGEQFGRFLLFDRQIMIQVNDHTSPKRPEFLVSTVSACKGPEKLLLDSERASRRFLLVDETMDVPYLHIRAIDMTGVSPLVIRESRRLDPPCFATGHSPGALPHKTPLIVMGDTRPANPGDVSPAF